MLCADRRGITRTLISEVDIAISIMPQSQQSFLQKVEIGLQFLTSTQITETAPNRFFTIATMSYTSPCMLIQPVPIHISQDTSLKRVQALGLG